MTPKEELGEHLNQPPQISQKLKRQKILNHLLKNSSIPTKPWQAKAI
jgi:hypothetical protein